jgi:DNA-binding GntR family transcriptional regulator
MVLQKKSNQAERAYQELRRMLLKPGLSPGTKLGETACAQQLGVNRGDARMAMARLFSEGLLDKGTKCGYRIPLLTAEQKAEIFEARLLLETAAARLAVQRATKSDLSRLHNICDDMEMMAGKGYTLGVCEADLRFHEALIMAAHNSKLTQIYLCSNLPLTFEKTTQTEPTAELLHDVRKHQKILAALEERNGDRVVELLEKGMETKNNSVKKVPERE